jgi:EpsI family protein
MCYLIRRAIIVATLMCTASALAFFLTPTSVTQHAQFDLETIMPRQFGEWKMDEQTTRDIINPQTQAFIDQLYSQTLARTYINKDGRHIMLSIAYGADQSHDKQIHKPEVCYPAQGFQVIRTQKVMIQAGGKELPAMRVETQLDGQYKRHEPVTYWIRLGDDLVRGLVEQTIVRIRYGFGGHIPDGVLFRISEINQDTEDSYELQDRFINELLPALTPDARKIMLGSY